MSYVSQGTVQVECKSGTPEIVVTISPCSEYAVKHRGKKYIAFVGSDGEALVCEETGVFIAGDENIKEMLVQAALRGTRVEVEIGSKSPGEIVAVRIPVRPQF